MKAIVLIARGLQTGALGCYGNPWIDTPAVDSLAADGVVFDWHFADAADAAGARRAWRSGRYRFPQLTPAADAAPQNDLLAVLRARGIRTCLILDDSRPAPPDFAEGWDEHHRIAPTEETTSLEAV